MYNPVKHVAGKRQVRRQRVGAEFKYCPDGSQVQFDEDCPSGGGGGNPSDWLPGGSGGTGGWGGWTNKPRGGGGGGGYTPPGGGGSGIPTGGGGTPGGGIPTGGGGTPGGGIPTGGCTPVCQPPVLICPENQKRIVLPFVPDSGYTASVTAGSEVRFVALPQNMFKPERMIIASSIAPFFDIVNFSIGNSPQSVATGNYSAEMYSEVSTYTDMTFDQCYPGIQVVLVAKNKSSVTQTFQAQLVGWADKP